MHKGYSEWFKLFENHKLSFSQSSEEMENLREIYARRNILVHNKGNVNSIYLKNIPNSSYQTGEKLNISSEYLEMAFATIKKLIFTIVIEASKLNKEKNKDLLNEVFSQGFEEMCKGNYTVSVKVFELLQRIKYQTENNKLSSRVNYLLSIKELYGLESIKKELAEFDTSALNMMFNLAKCVLLEEYEKVNNIIKSMINKQEINATIINDWPLFKRYRHTKQFQELKLLYAEEFHLTTVETASEGKKPDISIRTELNQIQNK